VTASFVKELLRKAALTAAGDDRSAVTDGDVQAALDDLLHATSAMTRVLLGVPRADGVSPPSDPSHAWLEAFPDE
jgi:hypothetical protein